MKSLFLLILTLIFSGQVVAQQSKDAQPIDVLIVGASHDYGKKLVEQFDDPINKILKFRPEAIFSEDLSVEDFNALTDYWNMANIKKRLAYVESIKYSLPRNTDKFIRDTYKLLKEHPNYHQDRMKLARALYLKHDFGNARYQLYRLDKAKSAFGKEETAAYRAILGVSDSLYRTRSSEYHNIFFPAMDKLNQSQIYPMDCQKYDLLWQKAWIATDSVFRQWDAVVEKDSNSADARRYASFNKHLADLTNRMRQARKEGKLTQFSNSSEGDEYSNIDSFYGERRLFGTTGFPEKEVLDMLRYWQLRNEEMCRNVVSRASTLGFKRVVVAVGANHRKIMADILQTMPGVKVYTLNEFNP